MKELELIKSNRTAFYLALFTVCCLAPLTFFVHYSFSQFSQPYKEIVSGMIALIIAGAIMYFTVKINKPVAMNFAYFEVMVATYYYITNLGWSWALIPALGFAVILPYSVAKYTDEIERTLNSEVPGTNKIITSEAPQELKDIQEKFNADKKIYEDQVNKFMDKNPDKPPSDFFK